MQNIQSISNQLKNIFSTYIHRTGMVFLQYVLRYETLDVAGRVQHTDTAHI